MFCSYVLLFCRGNIVATTDKHEGIVYANLGNYKHIVILEGDFLYACEVWMLILFT